MAATAQQFRGQCTVEKAYYFASCKTAASALHLCSHLITIYTKKFFLSFHFFSMLAHITHRSKPFSIGKPKLKKSLHIAGQWTLIVRNMTGIHVKGAMSDLESSRAHIITSLDEDIVICTKFSLTFFYIIEKQSILFNPI